MDEAVKRSDDHYRKPVSETTAEQWDEMLNSLPPVNWVNHGSVQSFKMSERTSGSITNIYVKAAGRYFVLADDIKMPHAEIVRRVQEFIRKGTR